MKKRKLLVKSTELSTWYSDERGDSVSLMKHTQMKTGISMYSLHLNGEPVITCDSFVFLSELMNRDFDLVLDILNVVLDLRNFTLANFESEE